MFKMKKKSVSMAVAAVLSGVVLVTTALAASNNVSGYEKLKASGFNLATMKNFTLNADYSLKFDKVDFATGTMLMKTEDSSHTSTRYSTTAMGETNTSEEYQMGDVRAYNSYDGGYYAYDSYYSYDPFSGFDELTDNQKKLIGTVFDMFAGDTKNYFTNKDGEISVKLERSQIPEFFQALMAVLSDQMKQEMSYYEDYYEEEDFEYQLYLLMDDLNFNSVIVNAVVDDEDMLNKLEFSVTISGKDQAGIEHFATLSFNCQFTNIGTTVADKIDLEGDNVTYRKDDWYYNYDSKYENWDVESESIDDWE